MSSGVQSDGLTSPLMVPNSSSIWSSSTSQLWMSLTGGGRLGKLGSKSVTFVEISPTLSPILSNTLDTVLTIWNQDWLIDYLLFYVPLWNFLLIWRRRHYWWRAAKFRLMVGAQGLWAGRDLYRTTPAVTQGFGFSSVIRRTAPFNHLFWLARGCKVLF
jgi:hypothetical protein